VAAVPSELSLSPFQETKKKKTNLKPWILQTVQRTPRTGDRPRRKTATCTQKKSGQSHMPRVGFEPTIQVFKRAETFHALDRAATVTGQETYKVI
jgi:hypothetical protein